MKWDGRAWCGGGGEQTKEQSVGTEGVWGENLLRSKEGMKGVPPYRGWEFWHSNRRRGISGTIIIKGMERIHIGIIIMDRL